jgi:hypothetical protein
LWPFVLVSEITEIAAEAARGRSLTELEQLATLSWKQNTLQIQRSNAASHLQ